MTKEKTKEALVPPVKKPPENFFVSEDFEHSDGRGSDSLYPTYVSSFTRSNVPPTYDSAYKTLQCEKDGKLLRAMKSARDIRKAIGRRCIVDYNKSQGYFKVFARTGSPPVINKDLTMEDYYRSFYEIVDKDYKNKDPLTSKDIQKIADLMEYNLRYVQNIIRTQRLPKHVRQRFLLSRPERKGPYLGLRKLLTLSQMWNKIENKQEHIHKILTDAEESDINDIDFSNYVHNWGNE